MPAIDDAPSESSSFLLKSVEVHPRRIVIKPRGHHVFGFLHGHPVDMVDAFSGLIVLMPLGASSQRPIPGFGIDRWAAAAQPAGFDCLRKPWNGRMLRRCAMLLFAHHDPPRIIEHRFAALVDPF